MRLNPIHWNGWRYSLSIRRHWNTFFLLAVVFEIKNVEMQKLLPESAGHHVLGIYELGLNAKDYFATSDHWYRFFTSLCDQYCEYYVLRRTDEANIFNTYHSAYINDRHAVQNFAKASAGYVGPDSWKLT